MAVGKKSSTARTIALIVVAIAIGVGIGWKANDLSEKVAVLEGERALEVAATNPEQGLFRDYSAVSDARLSRLDSEIFDARQKADDWILGLIAYVAGAIGLAGMIFLVIPAIEKALTTPRREDLADFTELGRQTKAALTAATTSIKKAIPRQPTVSGLSTADELRKWEELRKDGLVTDEEYKKMRNKLVG